MTPDQRTIIPCIHLWEYDPVDDAFRCNKCGKWRPVELGDVFEGFDEALERLNNLLEKS